MLVGAVAGIDHRQVAQAPDAIGHVLQMRAYDEQVAVELDGMDMVLDRLAGRGAHAAAIGVVGVDRLVAEPRSRRLEAEARARAALVEQGGDHLRAAARGGRLLGQGQAGLLQFFLMQMPLGAFDDVVEVEARHGIGAQQVLSARIVRALHQLPLASGSRGRLRPGRIRQPD